MCKLMAEHHIETIKTTREKSHQLASLRRLRQEYEAKPITDCSNTRPRQQLLSTAVLSRGWEKHVALSSLLFFQMKTTPSLLSATFNSLSSLRKSQLLSAELRGHSHLSYSPLSQSPPLRQSSPLRQSAPLILLSGELRGHSHLSYSPLRQSPPLRGVESRQGRSQQIAFPRLPSCPPRSAKSCYKNKSRRN